MRTHQDIPGWCKQLFACENIGATAKVLAAALGDISGGEAVGVFLLDVDKSQLLLFGSWSASHGEKAETLQAVSIHSDGDPLCFCLLNGSPYQAVLHPTATMALLNATRGNVYAMPLKSRLNGSIGGILVASSCEQKIQSTENIQIITMYAALIMENMILKRNESSIIAALRSDIVKLEKQTKQEQELAAVQIIGSSQAMDHVRSLIVKAAPTNAAVLITGETGTGKESAAEAIHALSLRKRKPFLKINCGALSPQLLESELFGHVKGAFTGADADYPGLLRNADGGSVLFDEIGDMPMELQVKLLRVLQDKKIRPVGSSRDYAVDIRIMAATNKDLPAAIQEGQFRPDLYHRIAVLDIHIPPLRERRQDIADLAAYFFEKLCKAHRRKGLSLSQEDRVYLCSLPLPGNTRELTNLIERSILFSKSSASYVSFTKIPKNDNDAEEKTLHLHAALKEYEADLIKRCLKRNLGHITKTAETLCVPRTTLSDKIKKLHLEQFTTPEVQ
jgi:transcriptional regulator with PAS, ATPase and Fis domain